MVGKKVVSRTEVVQVQGAKGSTRYSRWMGFGAAFSSSCHTVRRSCSAQKSFVFRSPRFSDTVFAPFTLPSSSFPHASFSLLPLNPRFVEWGRERGFLHNLAFDCNLNDYTSSM